MNSFSRAGTFAFPIILLISMHNTNTVCILAIYGGVCGLPQAVLQRRASMFYALHNDADELHE